MPSRKQNNRRSIRLRDFDYSSPGEYFITICTQNRKCLFGKIIDGEMESNEIGIIARKFWQQIPDRYENVNLDAFVVMPNHIHGIIGIEYSLESRPAGVIHELPLQIDDRENYRKSRRKMYLPKIIGWYKMNVSKQSNIILDNTGDRFWQRNYYEHIIRNEKSLHQIRDYILNNPASWKEDQNHPENF